MAVEAGLDTGPVYAEVATEIDPEETAEELRARLVDIGCRMLEEHLAGGRAGLPVPRDQAGNATYAEKIHSGELELDWSESAVRLRRVVRIGRAWTTFRGKRVGVLAAGPADAGGAEGDTADDGAPLGPGELRGAIAGAGGGSRLTLVTVQPEGKRPMDASAWLNGVRPGADDRLGT